MIQCRWVTYEEKLEESDRWSKPHMPTTSFQALDSLRRGVEEQTIDLHLNTTDDTEFYEIMGESEMVRPAQIQQQALCMTRKNVHVLK